MQNLNLLHKKFFLFQNEYFGFSELVDDDQKDISHMIHLVVIAICFWIMDRQVSLATKTQFSIGKLFLFLVVLFNLCFLIARIYETLRLPMERPIEQ